MGSWGVSGDGIASGEGARIVLGNFATRLRLRLPAGGDRLLDRLSLLWMARPFRRRGHAGTARTLHPGTGAGVARLEEAGKGFRYRHHLNISARLSTFHLCRPPHDGVQLYVARDSGSLSDISRNAAWPRGKPEGDCRNYLCIRRDLRRHNFWSSFAKLGPPSRHHHRRDLRPRPYPTLGFFTGTLLTHCRWISDAIHGAGRLGIVPVHLNELSPPALRGTFPGLAYQLGNFLAANAAVVEAKLAQTFRGADHQPDYAKASAAFAASVFVALIILAAVGREERGKEF